MKFKVGDRVKCLSGSGYSWGDTRGEIVEVGDGKLHYVRVDGESGRWSYWEEDLELITNKETTMENYINLGDKRIEISQETANNLKEQFGKEDRQWKPVMHDTYYSVGSEGKIENYVWTEHFYDKGLLSMSNVFKTVEQAKAHKMRLESMAKKYLPKNGEEYWIVEANTEKLFTDKYGSWDNDTKDIDFYSLGRTFRTKQKAQDWIDKYGKYWTNIN